MWNRRIALVGLSCLVSGALWAQDAIATDAAAQQIVHVMKAQFDRPDAPLAVHPVVVVGDAAVAGWVQGGRGGRALLHLDRTNGWSISVCAGMGLTQQDMLVLSGLSSTHAAELAWKVVQAESALTPAQRGLLDSFDGVLKVEGGSARGHAGR